MEEENKIIIKAVVEILGTPKEHVEDTIRHVVEKIKEQFKVINDVVYDAVEVKGLWSSFVDVEIEVKNFDDIIGICFDYMPSSIEIIKPEEFSITNNQIMDFLNDLIARLHKYDMVVKNLRAENLVLKKRINR